MANLDSRQSLIISLTQKYGNREKVFEARHEQVFPKIEIEDVEKKMKNDPSLIFGIFYLVSCKPDGSGISTSDFTWHCVTESKYEPLTKTDTHTFWPLNVGLVQQIGEGRVKIICGIHRPVGSLEIQIYNDRGRWQRRDRWFSIAKENGQGLIGWDGPHKTKESAIRSGRKHIADKLNFDDADQVVVQYLWKQKGEIPVFFLRDSMLLRLKKALVAKLQSLSPKSLWQKWTYWKVSLGRSMWRKFVQWDIDRAIKASCNIACRNLSKDRPLKILVDNDAVRKNAFSFFTPVYEESLEWPPGSQNTIQRASVVPRYRDVDEKHKESEDNLRFLAGIIYLAIEGYIEFYCSAELLAERYGFVGSSYTGIIGGWGYHLFGSSDIEIRKLDNPNSREWEDGLLGHWADFFNPPSEPRMKTRLKRWIENQRKSVPVFDKLVNALGPKNLLDAWHIHTANEHKMDFFLTMDFKICKNVKSQAGNSAVKGLSVNVVTPKELGEEIGVTPIPKGRFRYVWKNTVLRGEKKAPGLFGGTGFGWDEWVDWHRYFEE